VTQEIYQQRGALFPLLPFELKNSQSKRPAVADWPNADYDSEAIKAYRAEGRGIGWAIPEGIIVIDVDAATDERPDKKGDQSFLKLGLVYQFELTFEVKSPSGGRHLYFKIPEGETNLKKSLKAYPDIDFLSKGCYVVTAGSPHWQGGTYEARGQEIKDLPPALIAALRKPDPLPRDPGEIWSPEQLETLLDELDPRMFRVREQWFKLMASCHEATDGEGCNVFIDWSTSDPQYADAAADIQYQWDKLSPEGGITRATLVKAVSEYGTSPNRLSAIPNSILDLFDGPNVASVTAQVPDDLEVLPEPKKRDQYRPNYKTVHGITIPENDAEEIIGGLLRRREVANLIAPPKSNKTWLVNHLALACSIGTQWLDFKCRKCRVLILDNELRSQTLAIRLNKISTKRFGRPLDQCRNISFECLRDRLISFDINNLEYYIDFIPSGEFDLVILDAVYKFLPHGCNENDNSQMTQFYRRLERYATKLDAAVVAVHHTSKGSQSGKRVTDKGAGAGAINRSADTIITINEGHDGTYHYVSTKCRTFQDKAPFAIKWEYPNWVVKDDIEPQEADKDTPQKAKQAKKAERVKKIKEVIKDVGQKGIHVTGISEQVGKETRQVRRDLKTLLDSKEIESFFSNDGGGRPVTFYRLKGLGGRESYEEMLS